MPMYWWWIRLPDYKSWPSIDIMKDDLLITHDEDPSNTFKFFSQLAEVRENLINNN